MGPPFLIYVVYVERETDPVPLFSSEVKFLERKSPAFPALPFHPELRLSVSELRLLFADPCLPLLDAPFFVTACSLILAAVGFVSYWPDACAGH